MPFASHDDERRNISKYPTVHPFNNFNNVVILQRRFRVRSAVENSNRVRFQQGCPRKTKSGRLLWHDRWEVRVFRQRQGMSEAEWNTQFVGPVRPAGRSLGNRNGGGSKFLKCGLLRGEETAILSKTKQEHPRTLRNQLVYLTKTIIRLSRLYWAGKFKPCLRSNLLVKIPDSSDRSI